MGTRPPSNDSPAARKRSQFSKVRLLSPPFASRNARSGGGGTGPTPGRAGAVRHPRRAIFLARPFASSAFRAVAYKQGLHHALTRGSCLRARANDRSTMTQQGATLQNYNNELVKCIEDLREKREEVNRSIAQDEEEKAKIQNDLRILTERLARINDNLARKVSSRTGGRAYVHESIEDLIYSVSSVLRSVQDVP